LPISGVLTDAIRRSAAMKDGSTPSFRTGCNTVAQFSTKYPARTNVAASPDARSCSSALAAASTSTCR
jgi:hypothetical protein